LYNVIMKYQMTFLLFFFIIFSLPASGSRQYQPISELKNQFYQNIDKSIWPDDVRVNIELYRNSNIGWVGVVEKYMTDFSNEDYNLIGFHVRHHYYDWIEEVGGGNKIYHQVGKVISFVIICLEKILIQMI